MRARSGFLILPLMVVLVGCGVASSDPMPAPAPGQAPSIETAARRLPGQLGTFRLTFGFEGKRRPERDVLIVLAPFSAKRDAEGAYDASRMLDAAGAIVGSLGARDRVSIICYYPLPNTDQSGADDPLSAEDAADPPTRPLRAPKPWGSPTDAREVLGGMRERGPETVRNTSKLIELLAEADGAFDPEDGRVKEIIVVADSFAVPSKGLLSGLPIELPEIRLEPLDPAWTSALFYRMRRDDVHVNFIAVARDEHPAFWPTRLRRMAESTHGFYFDWPDDEAARAQCAAHIATGLYRGLDVNFGESDANFVMTNRWLPDGDAGFVVWGRYNTPGTYTFTLRDAVAGTAYPFEVTLPDEADAAPELEAEWARQRIIDGVWRLATYGPDEFLTYDLQQLAYRYGLKLPESLGPSPFDGTKEPESTRRPLGKGRELEVPVLPEGGGAAHAKLPPHSTLAELAPYDTIYVHYNRLRSVLQLIDVGYFYGRDAIQALGLHPDITLIEARAETQMCVRVSRDLTKLYEAAVAEVAQVSTGATVGDGRDLCLIMRLKMPRAYHLRINQFRRMAEADYPGTKIRRFRHEGVVVTETLGQHNVVRSYFAMFKHTPRGLGRAQWFAVSGNSWAAVRRVLDVHAGKVPSIVANADFAQFREKLPLAGFTDSATGKQIGENAFVYFGAPAALTLTDWRLSMLQDEQRTVVEHLRLFEHALHAYARDHRVLLDEPAWPDTIATTLVDEGYMPGIPVHPGIGAYAFDSDLQVFYSTRYGRLGWLTPMADMVDQAGEPHYGVPEVGASAAQLAWTDDVVLARAITQPDPKDFKFALLRALAGRETSDFATFDELMRRPGLSVAMKSRLLQYGKGGLGMSKTQIALNFLANKIKSEIKRLIGWESKDDPFDWADDELCIVLESTLADWRTALIDPAFMLGIKAKKPDEAAAFLQTIAGEAANGDADTPPVVTVRGLSFAMLGDAPAVIVARDPRLLEQPPTVTDTALRRFLPPKAHALIRVDTTETGGLVRTALGLYGPAAEAQAQLAMARFESRYGNRVAPLRLEDIAVMEDAPRPAGSQYGVDPVEHRIASDVYGLPGDFLLSGRVPLDAGIRKALSERAVGYGAVVLHRDSIAFIGAAPNPGIASWRKDRPPRALTVSRRIRALRTTDSPRTLAAAVRDNDGYLWRLGLRGFELDADRFGKRLRALRRRRADEERIDDAFEHVSQTDATTNERE